MLEKRGVVDDETPQPERPGLRLPAGAALTKEGADQLQQHLTTDLVDAVVQQTQRNRR